jgi:hypothetical protein
LIIAVYSGEMAGEIVENDALNKAATDGSGQDFLDHWDWAAKKGLLNRNTAHAIRAAVSRILRIEGPNWPEIDVRSIDEEGLLDRFENLEKKQFSPGSLATYRSRFRKGRQLYLSYLEDPKNYRPQSRERVAAAQPGGESVRRQRPRSRGESVADKTPSQHGDLVRYPFPVRAGVMAELFLPADLRRDEADRLAKFLQSLSLEQYLALPGRSEETHKP